jgi:hypothetical protein
VKEPAAKAFWVPHSVVAVHPAMLAARNLRRLIPLMTKFSLMIGEWR